MISQGRDPRGLTHCEQGWIKYREHSQQCRNHNGPSSNPTYAHSLIVSSGALIPTMKGLSAIVCLRPAVRVERDESRRQYAAPRHHIRRSAPRTAPAVRLGPEYRNLWRGLVGLCALVASGFGHAVRPLRRGIGSGIDRSCQHPVVDLLCRDVDGCARFRSSPAAADSVVRGCRALADRLPYPGLCPCLRCTRAHELGHHHDLYLGDGI